MAKKDKNQTRSAVHTRIRKKISGTAERPRLAIFRSVNHIYVQVIDDGNGVTLTAASSREKSFGNKGGNVAAAKEVGKLIAERAKEKGVTRVVFDRGGYNYHGRVKRLAEAPRQGRLGV